MIYRHKINNLHIQTGDIICTTDGSASVGGVIGCFWYLLGKLIPGSIDHIIIYVGPEGRCIEAGIKGVITFEIGEIWDTKEMLNVRGIIDTFYGVVYPLHDYVETCRVRESVSEYCLSQVGKKYNFNFFHLSDEKFYCSHLAYAAYLQSEISLVEAAHIIYPQKIWDACCHRRSEK